MDLRFILPSLRTSRHRGGRRGRGRERTGYGLYAVEPLEERVLMSTYTVIGVGDDAGTVRPAGPGRFIATTLRAALTATREHAIPGPLLKTVFSSSPRPEYQAV